MINPNTTYSTNGKVTAIESFTSFTVYKVATKQGMFDYTVFGSPLDLHEGDKLDVAIGYSIMAQAYAIRYIDKLTKAA